MNFNREDMNIVIVGHVDHGKSTIIGRLLADTNSLPEGKLEQVKERCRRNSKPFEYAFLLDALKDEQEQGITIDAARCFFKTEKRDYIIIDAPGHIEFLKNMVTGASRAEVALLVIDAEEGIKENSKRHGYLLSMLGIKNVVVLINKMDLVNYDEKVFENITKEYTEFLNKIDVEPKCFIPVSGFFGENIVDPSNKMSWYKGQSVLEVLDSFEKEKLPDDKPFRMPVQAVYKFTRDGDNRRIVAGTIETGRVKVGDEVIFYPSGKKSTVKSIEVFNGEARESIGSGYAAGFTLNEQIYIKRGEMAAISGDIKPKVTNRIKVNLFWLGRSPMVKEKEYILKVGTSKVEVKIEEITKVIDASNLNNEVKQQIDRHEVAECILKTDKPIAFDLSHEIAQTSRFVIVDKYEIAGGGIILKELEDEENKAHKENYKWEKSYITLEERAEKFGQKPALICITGKENTRKKAIARALERKLFSDGRRVYFLGINNTLYAEDHNKKEHIKRLSEVSNIMMDSGSILIATASELNRDDIETMEAAVNSKEVIKVWVGENEISEIDEDLFVSKEDTVELAVDKIKSLLQKKNIIFKPF
ncbi:adenylylsulfate kinase [Clostridium carboxidivorans P7]|uniref:sulfate adenylyltransferase n=1 Tax=Clostridium carboxidivorans P7 TaxID=536227 RepID=C6PP07_9CLOT|nr:GTP-binding protein [Clostridium carboxidivorans]AKN31243.1 adenylylsulfate kinase [Clostridium carboxidivorans P7]EET89085.1 sulfate adenylyltransferase, large subunit [Clostridium carboxidivorans P7]EFG88360.1 putative translation elongation factor Tu [Clostridium carboxidivorans P7]